MVAGRAFTLVRAQDVKERLGKNEENDEKNERTARTSDRSGDIEMPEKREASSRTNTILRSLAKFLSEQLNRCWN